MKKYKFYCDIRGTYDKGIDREKSLLKFVSLLNDFDCDEISFSFVSSDKSFAVKEFVDEFKRYIDNTKIKLGKQYSDEEVIDGNEIYKGELGKLSQIYKDVNESNYDKVYYAEDQDFFIKAINKIFEKKLPTLDLIIFKSGTGIDSLIECIQEYCKQQKRM